MISNPSQLGEQSKKPQDKEKDVRRVEFEFDR